MAPRPSLHRAGGGSAPRPVPRSSRFALWFLAAFLLFNAATLLYVAWFVAGRRQLFPVVAGSALGLFLAVCGVAVLVQAIRQRSRGGAGRERVAATARPAGPPAGISVTAEGEATVYTWRTLPRSPFWWFFWGSATLFLAGLAGLAVAGTVVELTHQPAWLVLVQAALAALTVGLMWLVSRLVERTGFAPLGLVAIVLFVANALLGAKGFVFFGALAVVTGYLAALSGFVLLARCRLRVSPEGLDYRERVLGLPLAWRRRTLAADEVVGFGIQSAVRGGGAVEVHARTGPGFTLMIPQGAGAFSRDDLERLRDRWLEGLGR